MTAITEPGQPPHDPAEPIAPDQSLGELMGRMTSDVGSLISTQIELAKVEIKEEVSRAGKGAGMVGGGGLAAWFALLLLSMGIAFGIGNAIDSVGWGFVLVGLVYALIAAVLVLKGRQQITSATPIAEQTMETLKEDVEWARQQRT
ncbi:MAG: phage holin family protein [Acidimicrobiales bacterium]